VLLDVRGRQGGQGLPQHCLARMNRTDAFIRYEVYRRNNGVFDNAVPLYHDQYFGSVKGNNKPYGSALAKCFFLQHPGFRFRGVLPHVDPLPVNATGSRLELYHTQYNARCKVELDMNQNGKALLPTMH
jgi:hypothetical protein